MIFLELPDPTVVHVHIMRLIEISFKIFTAFFVCLNICLFVLLKACTADTIETLFDLKKIKRTLSILFYIIIILA